MNNSYPNEHNGLYRLVVQPQLFDVDSACALLSISRSTFYQLVKDGRIIVSKLGTKTLVSSYAIERFVREMHAKGVNGNK